VIVAVVGVAILSSRVVNQNLPHGQRRRGKKVAAILPLAIVLGLAQPRFMDQNRRLQHLATATAPHVFGSQCPEFPIDVSMQHFRQVKCRGRIG
jgi:hypothetical protein